MLGLPVDWGALLRLFVQLLVALGFVVINFMWLLWLERKLSAWIQIRVGPWRVGRPHGWLQLVADAIKIFAKEDIRPRDVDRWVWALGPIVAFVPPTVVLMFLPYGPNGGVFNMNIGLLMLGAITSYTIYGIFMGGWGSNNKYSLFGGMRSAAQMFSYEVPLVLSVLGVVMLAGTLNLNEIVEAQSRLPFIVYQPLGFLIFLIAGIAELNRTPFDLSEAEQELVAGYATEYSGLRWGLFFFGEYTALFVTAALATTLFLGGWRGPFLPPAVWFFLKSYAFVAFSMWIRWTLPRLRIDHLMDLSWKFLIPVSLLNIALTGLYIIIVG